jgi:cytochrome c-type biogenesis protein CcmH/NrfF
MLAFGTGIALLPERSYSFALAKMPADPATGTAALLLVFLLTGGTTLFAQHPTASTESPDAIRTSFYARNDLERRLQHEIVCTCGCGHTDIAECRKDACATSHKMRGEVAALIDQGKSHDEVIQWFVTTYGSEEMLGAPLNTGFNRIAWLFPYLIGATSAVAIGFAAVKWTRHLDTTPEAPAAADPRLEERLDDELRNLD